MKPTLSALFLVFLLFALLGWRMQTRTAGMTAPPAQQIRAAAVRSPVLQGATLDTTSPVTITTTWFQIQEKTGTAVLSPDGQKAVFDPTDEYDQSVYVMDSASGELLHTLENARSVAALRSDSRAILTSDGRMWSLDNGDTSYTLEIPRDILSASFSPAEQLLVTVHDNQVIVWEAATGRRLLAVPGNLQGFSPNERMLVTYSEYSEKDELRLWDVVSGKQMRSFAGQRAAMSPDQQTFVTFDKGTKKPRFQIRDSRSGRTMRTVPGEWPVFSRDGALLASVDDDVTNVWDAGSGERIASFDGRKPGFTPDGQAIATYQDGETTLWTLADDQTQARFPGETVAFSPDSRFAVMSDNPEYEYAATRLWDISSQQPLDWSGYWMTFSPDGQLIIGIDIIGIDETELRVWDSVSGTDVGKIALEGVPHNPMCSLGYQVTFRPDGLSAFITAHTTFCLPSGEPTSALPPSQPVSTVLTTTHVIRQK